MTEEEILLKIAAYRIFTKRFTPKDTFDNVINKTKLDYYKQPINLYLFETDFDGIYKYGITKNHPEQRANTSKSKEFYKTLIFKRELKDRYTAIALEQAFKNIFNTFTFGHMDINKYSIKNQTNLTTQKKEDLITKIKEANKLLGLSTKNRFERLASLKKREGITELTIMNKVEFEEKINEIYLDYEALNIWEFTKKYFKWQMEEIENDVEKTLVKKEIIWITRRNNLMQYYEIDYSKYDPENPKSVKRYKELKPPFNLKDKPGNDHTDEYVPIKELPFIFNKYFGVSLF